MYLYASLVTKTKKQTNVISLNRSIHTPCLTLFSAIKARFIEAFQMRFLIKKKIADHRTIIEIKKENANAIGF